MASSNPYKDIIAAVNALPPKVPREQPKQKPRLVKKVGKFLMSPAKEAAKAVVQDAWRFIAVGAMGSTVLEEQVPIHRLHQRMCIHVGRLLAEVMSAGDLPCRILIADRFITFIDLGKGRCIAVRVQLHTAALDAPTTASFIVEESEIEDSDPWDSWADKIAPGTPKEDIWAADARRKF